MQVEISSAKMWDFAAIFNKLAKVNNHPLGENSGHPGWYACT
jgi:hypothetical protein